MAERRLRDRSRARPPGLTGADLANIANEAAIAAARGRRTKLEQADFDYALERVVAGMQSRRALTEHERRVIAFHEAGHALLRRAAAGRRPHAQDLDRPARHRRSATSLHFPEEDRYLKTRAELMDQMTVLLGGRAAEELVFGSITNGASDDLKRVAAISRAMIHEWAMGTSVSALQLAAEGGAVSDRTRELRDAEQQHLADEAMRRAVRLLTDPPRAARPARRRAAAPGGARARRHRAHHGRRADAAPRRGRPPAGRRRRADERPKDS